MGPSLPPDVQVTEEGSSIHWRFPRRQLGGSAFAFGGAFVVFGLLFSGLPLSMVLGLLGGADAPFWFLLPFLLIAGLFTVIGLVPVAIGLLVLAGHSEVAVTPGRVSAGDGVGRWLWWRHRSTDKVRRIVVDRSGVKVNGKQVTEGPLANLAGLKLECEGEPEMFLALAYPADWLLPLAEELSRRCGVAAEPTASATSTAPPVEVVERSPDPDGFVERREKPTKSQVVVEEHPDGVTLIVPPAGLWRGSKGFFAFSLFWCGFMTVFTALTFGAAPAEANVFWMFTLFIIVFWAIGIGMMLGAVHMGRRQAVLAVAGGSLLVMQSGLWGTKRHEWSCADVRDVRPGPSGMEVNDRPVLELQVLPADGAKFGLLAGRDEDELAWIATVLRRAVRLTSEPRTPSAS